MRSLIIACLTFVSVACTGQAPAEIRYKKISIGIIISPDYCYRFLNYNSTNKWVEESRNHDEIPVWGFTAGLAFQYAWKKNIYFSSGLFYTNKGEQTKYTALNWPVEDDPNPVRSKTKFIFTYLELPFTATKVWGSKNLKWLTTAGVSLNIFTQRKTIVITTTYDGHRESHSSDVDAGYLKFNLEAVLGIGLEYDFSERASFSFQTFYKQFISSIVAAPDAKEYPYSFGATIGLNYKFKKKRK